MSNGPDTEPSKELEEIRELLFGSSDVTDTIGDELPRLIHKTIRQSQDEMSQIFMPVVRDSIRLQVYQARDEMVEIFYPLIGEMVGKSVREAIRTLTKTIDAQLKRNANPVNVAERWRANLQGISSSEYYLRKTLPFAVRDVFLIHHETGLLIYHYSQNPESGQDADLVSGMLTAIRDFAKDAFGDGSQGELGAIEYENLNILLISGAKAYMAVAIDGVEPMNFRGQVREVLYKLHQQHHQALSEFDGTDEALNTTVAQVIPKIFQEVSVEEKDSGSQRVIGGILGVLLVLVICAPLSVCGWWMWQVQTQLTNLTVLLTPSPTATVTQTAPPTPTQTHTITPTFIPPTSTASPTHTSTSTPSPTTTSVSQAVGEINGGFLNLRAGPGVEYDILNTLPGGEQITAFQISPDKQWVYVYTADGQNGWLYQRFVTWQSRIDVLPLIEN